MDQQFIDDTAGYIRSIIDSGIPVSWSWGPGDFRATAYNRMAALRFSVNGVLHKGDVVVAYNRGSDMFEVYCLDGSGKVVSSNDDVCFDELVEAIDRLVEKNCSDAEYHGKRGKWFADNSITVIKWSE
jgi:hypothetical protein